MNWNLAFWREFIAQLGDAPTSCLRSFKALQENMDRNMMGHGDQGKGESVGGGALNEGRSE